MPGESIAIDVFLQTTMDVAAMQNAIELGPEIRIALDDLGQPLCTINPEINKYGDFTSSCDQAGVCTLEALVVALDNLDPIPDGSILYTCQIDVDSDSVLGTYPLTCAPVSSQDPEGNEISTVCLDGWVLVVGPPPPPSPTPTKTLPPPVATATATARISPTPTATRTSDAGFRDEDDGCQVSAHRAARGLWLLALPAAVLLRQRRKRTPTRRR